MVFTLALTLLALLTSLPTKNILTESVSRPTVFVDYMYIKFRHTNGPSD